MAYPVRDITRPRVLEGTTNGKLPDDVLVTTKGLAGGVDVRLVKPAAQAWRALTAAALAAGHTLKAVGPADSYRPYEVQERIFRQRYQLTPLSGRPTKTWQGRVWYQLPRTAIAAVPGTSNHGWGITVDTGEENDGDAGAESLDNPTLGWLLANEERFGWSHELQSEPWHIRYFAGDQIPQAVLEFEAGHPNEEDDVLSEIQDKRLRDVNVVTTNIEARVIELTALVRAQQDPAKFAAAVAEHLPDSVTEAEVEQAFRNVLTKGVGENG